MYVDVCVYVLCGSVWMHICRMCVCAGVYALAHMYICMYVYGVSAWMCVCVCV